MPRTVLNATPLSSHLSSHAGPAGMGRAVARIIECHNTPHGGAVTPMTDTKSSRRAQDQLPQ